MLLVFDSYDCAGKTTLAKAYAKKFKIPLYLEGASQRPEFKSYEEHKLWSNSAYNHLARLLTSGAKFDMVMDRWIFTEYCYSPILRGYDIKDYYRKIENLIAHTGKVVWIFPFVSKLDVLKRRYVDKKESFLTFKNLLKVKDNFEALFSSTKYPGMAIDTSDSKGRRSDVLSTIDMIKSYTNNIKEY
jgi:thymidylate kinase